ncbi:hypothetical protein [Blastococcus sp. SYSU DS0539]
MTGPGGEVRSTVRPGTATSAPDASARRLLLTAAEWAVLVGGRLSASPPAFRPAPVGRGERDAAVAALAGRGVLRAPAGGPVEPAPAVAADLAVLRSPLLAVRLEVAGRGGARQGWFALGSGGVVVVLSLPHGGVDLSLAPGAGLGRELFRAVPDAAAVTGAPPGNGAPPAGALPLDLLDASPAGGGGPAATAGERALADELLRRTAGSLGCLVLGRAGTSVGAGQVCWLATDGGWAGLRPRPGEAHRVVDVVPVRPADLGAWVAPTVAALLAAGS